MKDVRGVQKAALIWPAQASAKARVDGYRKDLERVGIEIVLQTEVAVTETNYADDAANIEAAKADIVLTTLEISGMSRLAKAMEQNGYFPKVPAYGAQAYGRNFLAQAGSAAEPTVLGLAYSILEDAGSVPAIKDFVTWYERTNPGADIDFFAIMAWAAADLYVDALRAVDGPPTRDKVLAALQATTEYDADGMLAPINPAQKKGAGCFMIAEVDGGRWIRTHPAQGFDCSRR
jgi:ABC-type branched-subunit amino acid transport system substrate-binding protein